MSKKRLEILDSFYSERFASWFDKLTFPKILLLWSSIILLFGVGYYSLGNNYDHLMYIEGGVVNTISDCIYFSFITATTTGYGDIIPVGSFRSIAIFEVVIGMILLAIVTSRLVSIKQNVILDQIYSISLSDNVNRLRLSLSLFMQNISNFILDVQDKKISAKAIQELDFNFLQYEDVIKNIGSIAGFDERNETFKKSLNLLDQELLVFSLINSLEKISMLYDTVRADKALSKKFTHSRQILKRVLPKTERFLDSFENIDGEIDFENFVSRKNHALRRIKRLLKIKIVKK